MVDAKWQKIQKNKIISIDIKTEPIYPINLIIRLRSRRYKLTFKHE